MAFKLTSLQEEPIFCYSHHINTMSIFEYSENVFLYSLLLKYARGSLKHSANLNCDKSKTKLLLCFDDLSMSMMVHLGAVMSHFSATATRKLIPINLLLLFLQFKVHAVVSVDSSLFFLISNPKQGTII